MVGSLAGVATEPTQGSFRSTVEEWDNPASYVFVVKFTIISWNLSEFCGVARVRADDVDLAHDDLCRSSTPTLCLIL